MSFPSFEEFYRSVHARAPFPWQVRLADTVIADGWAGMLLDLPTGAGKTSVLDVAVYSLARAPERMPRRTVLVIDRRIVVDQAAEHARHIKSCLDAAKDGPARLVADELRALATENPGSCMSVAVMRGGMPRDNDWARRPDQVMLGVSTVDQLGSRLLFRGYGINPRSASIQAGLVGNDTLILLDEVHLAAPFAETLQEVVRYRRTATSLPERFAVVQMSATARTRSVEVRSFRLTEADRQHPVLAARLGADKLARLQEVKVTGEDEAIKSEVISAAAVEQARALQTDGASVVGIVVNRVDTARRAAEILRSKHSKATDCLIVTGRMRPIDRDLVVRQHLRRADAATRARSEDEPSLVVVATQCIEAGADLDFDGIVTECASLDALRQRFGRVDRRGQLRKSSSVIIGRSDQVGGKPDPVYGTSPAATWAYLRAISDNGVVNFGIHALQPPLTADEQPDPAVLAPTEPAPVLMAAHLDTWAQTSIRIPVEPDVATWLHGPQRKDADVQILWRDLPTYGSDRAAAQQMFELVRPSSLETISVPVWAVQQWLVDRIPPSFADVATGEMSAASAGRNRAAAQDSSDDLIGYLWSGDEATPITAADLGRRGTLRPGMVLVLDRSIGGLQHFVFDPTAREAVVDVGDLAQLRARGLPTLRLSRDALSCWSLPDEVVATIPTRGDEEDLRSFTARVREWISTWPGQRPAGSLATDREYEQLRGALTGRRLRVHRVRGLEVVIGPRIAPVDERDIGEAVSEGDDSSFRAAALTLTKHSEDARELAFRFARVLGFPEEVANDLALAAWFHDAGKADPRFQAWLAGGDEVRAAMQDEPLAKSALPPGSAAERAAARVRAGYPAGARHELLSLAMVSTHATALSAAHDRELVLHLVASHHGWCRPFPPLLEEDAELHVTFRHGDHELSGTSRHRLARLDSGVADRFWKLTRRYGWWGLAWMEAVLRLADHRVSEAAEEAR